MCEMVHSKLFKTCNGRDIFIIMKYNCLNEVVAYESTTMTNRSEWVLPLHVEMMSRVEPELCD
jgi:hypothetical protein